MKKAFTLIEFILVITIIGVLLVLSFSEFYKILKSSNSFGNLSSNISIQLAKNAYHLLPSIYLTNIDLNGDDSDVKLKDLITIHAKNWKISDDGNLISYNDDSIDSMDKQIIELELSAERKITLRVFCNKFINLRDRDACKKLMPKQISTTSF